MRIFVDGCYVGSLGADCSITDFPLPPDSDVVSVYASGLNGDSDLLLASHMLFHSAEGVPLPSKGSVKIGRRRFIFEISYDPSDPDRATCTVRLKGSGRRPFEVLTALRFRWVAGVAAIATLAIAFWFVHPFRSPRAFAVIVPSNAMSARSTLADSDMSRELITVPAAAEEVSFTMKPHVTGHTRYKAVVSIDNQIAKISTIDLKNDVVNIVCLRRELRTGTYSIELFAPDTASDVPLEIYRFQLAFGR